MKPIQHFRFIRLKGLLSLGFFAAGIWLAGCSDKASINTASVPANKAEIRTFASMQKGTINSSTIFGKAPAITDLHSTADSIVITRARILVGAIQLHPVGGPEDTIIIIKTKDDDEHEGMGSGNGHGKGLAKGHHKRHRDNDEDVEIRVIEREDGTIRVGPFIAEFDTAGETIVSRVAIPPGTYDKVKFEIHQLNENDDSTLLNDSLFGDFVNGARYTIIIDGFAYIGGKAYPFSYRSSQTDNVTVTLDPPAVYDANHTYDLRLVFDPKIMFARPGQKPLDPRDPDNREAIELMIRNSIRVL
ncbi:MAG: hypothetical protein Q8916_02605 [Bacteroidota bacterium]|nr:hypothetical protein [Bacteroidota bacterium]MDP4229278.1 hypothetical protein [Bacteroidota bacterium]MDP4234897.1 hypothetical protein [Bacteroidota bacterium]